MYWACWNDNGHGAIIYSGVDPMERDETWDESYPYEFLDEAQACLDLCRAEWHDQQDAAEDTDGD